MLEVSKLSVRYGRVQALWEASISLSQGERVALLGPNGSGKSSALNAISGVVFPSSGTIHWDGRPVTRMPPHRRVRSGVAHVLERHRVFSGLTVEENLLVTLESVHDDKGLRRSGLQEIWELLPQLHPLRMRPAQLLSGGEQQLLSIARGLLLEPRLIMMDEPLLGLSREYVQVLSELVDELTARDIAVLMTEQNVNEALSICQRGYILISGEIVAEGRSDEILKGSLVRETFLGEVG